MKILDVKPLRFPEIKVIRFARFHDHRGYFAEHNRRSDLQNHPQTGFLKRVEFLQTNESFSRVGTIRGLHFQWNPFMGKLIRTIHGHMVDLILDIRIGSPTFGKILAYDMPSNQTDDFNEWIWAPPGFAHGNLFLKDTTIEYFCSGEYSPGCEAGISPLAEDIDWLTCERNLRESFLKVAGGSPLITDKDKNGFTVSGWAKDDRSRNFVYHELGS